jgi:uncharacterized phage protein (TIGR02218 family)
MSKDLINKMIGAGERFVTCFQLTLKNRQIIYLTSSDSKVICENLCYLPNSGLTIENAIFNDSAHNEVRIKGIFESGGIEKNLDLDGMGVRIFFHFPEKSLFLEWLILSYSEIQYNGMSFALIVKPEIVKLHKSLLQNFSTSCRASFGDSKCKIQSWAYAEIYDVVSVAKNIVKISGCTRPNGFFDGGRISFNDNSSYEIKSHIEAHSLVLTKNCTYIAPGRATLTPSCDKNFVTCCNRYKNAVNFRGEPRIPFG